MDKKQVVGNKGMIFKGEQGTISKEGVVTARRRYLWPVSMPFWSQGRIHPENGNLTLVSYTYETRHDSHYGVWHDVTYIYEGGESGDWGFEPTTTYSLRISANEEPIPMHPNFSRFATEDNAVWDAEGIFKGFKKGSDLEGIMKYLAPGAEWVMTRTSRIGAPTISGVGKISSPPGAPAAPATYNWLDVGGTMEQRGSVYVVTHVWRLSGPGGWNRTIYS